MTELDFTVWGNPAPQGSHRAFVRNGRAIVTDDSKATKPWKAAVEAAIREALAMRDEPWAPARRASTVSIQFHMRRPKAHYRSDGTLRPGQPELVTTKPDIDKLARAVLDALVNAGVLADDAYVTDLHLAQRYALGSPFASIAVDTHIEQE